jgi:signal transduction histidine kinase/ActR/RegA family two-component response regulator
VSSESQRPDSAERARVPGKPYDGRATSLPRELAALGDPSAALTAIFAESPVAFRIFDLAGRSVVANPAYAAMFDASPPEANVLRGDLAELRPSIDLVERAARGETVRSPAAWYERAGDARRIAIESTFFPLRDGAGAITHVVAALKDVTAELSAKEEAEREREGALVERERLAVLAEVTARLTSVVTQDDAIDALPRVAVPRFADYSALDLVEPDGRVTRVGVACTPSAEPLAAELTRSYPGDAPGSVAHVLQSGHALRVTTREEALAHMPPEDAAHLDELAALGLRSWLVVPIWIAGRTIGTLSFIRSDPARPYDAADQALAEELGARASATFERSRLHEATELARRQAELAADHVTRLQLLTAALSEAATTDQVVRAVVSQGARATGADAIGIFSLDTGKLELVRASGLSPELEQRIERVANAPDRPAAIVVASREPVWVRSAREYAERFPASFDAPNRRMSSFACIPMMIEQRLLGVLVFGYLQAHAFATEEQAFLITLTHQCVQALERARLYEAERRSNREAQEANRLKDEFLSVVSHELRTPLTAILGWSKILSSQSKAPDPVARGLAVIERNAKAQVRIIDDILDVSRIITGKLRISLREADLGAVAAAAFDVLRPTAEAKGVTLEAHVEPGTPAVLGDPDRLQQVAWNLLSNAIKFTPRGGKVTFEVEPGEGSVLLRVSDSGSGIRPDFLPYVFDRFRQGDSSSTREHGGLGLGLAIVRHLVELHGGTVRAESHGPSAGSTFTVVLPALRRAPTPPAAPAPAPPASRDVTGVRVLLVDDEPDTLETIAALLVGAHAMVRMASSAREALAELDSFRADVLVSDVAMPGEDGLALLARVRSRDDGARLPAIALTAYAGPDEAKRVLDAGFTVHLAKPVDSEALLRAVAALAHGKGSADSVK